MSKRYHFGIVGVALAFVFFTNGIANAELVRVAHNGLDFVQAVVNADNYRAEAGGLAMKKSASADVREFGRTLWEDSIEDTRRLHWQLGKHEPGVILPSRISPEYMFFVDQLVAASGD